MTHTVVHKDTGLSKQMLSDVDECENGSSNCDENADCINTIQSFNCVCKRGYSGNGQTCERKFTSLCELAESNFKRTSQWLTY